jgi:hypothetical protein
VEKYDWRADIFVQHMRGPAPRVESFARHSKKKIKGRRRAIIGAKFVSRPNVVEATDTRLSEHELG